ncbi:hypothetical protein BJX99DRAFT_238040 [Aspergillus californicus]
MYQRSRVVYWDIDVYSLEEGRKMYSLKSGRNMHTTEQTSPPTIMGEDRIYFVGKQELSAFDLKSGGQLYCVEVDLCDDQSLPHWLPLPQPPWSPWSQPHWPTWPQPVTSKFCALLQNSPSNQELPLVVENDTLHVINGADGKVLQKIEIDLLLFAYIAVAPGHEEFAILSQSDSLHSFNVRIQKFTTGPDHLFYTKCIENMPLKTDKCHSGWVPSIDPFRYLVAKVRCPCGTPEICRIGTQTYPQPPPSIEETVTVVNYGFHEGLGQEITLPPRLRPHRAHRPFIIPNLHSWTEMRFVDGNRLISHTTGPSNQETYFIFDFGLRVRHKKRT